LAVPECAALPVKVTPIDTDQISTPSKMFIFVQVALLLVAVANGQREVRDGGIQDF
jgi:hypothetical protein